MSWLSGRAMQLLPELLHARDRVSCAFVSLACVPGGAEVWVRSHGPPVGVHAGLLPHAHVCRFGRCAATTPVPAACQEVAVPCRLTCSVIPFLQPPGHMWTS